MKRLSYVVKILSWTLCLLFLPASLQENNVGLTAVDRLACSAGVILERNAR